MADPGTRPDPFEACLAAFHERLVCDDVFDDAGRSDQARSCRSRSWTPGSTSSSALVAGHEYLDSLEGYLFCGSTAYLDHHDRGLKARSSFLDLRRYSASWLS